MMGFQFRGVGLSDADKPHPYEQHRVFTSGEKAADWNPLVSFNLLYHAGGDYWEPSRHHSSDLPSLEGKGTRLNDLTVCELAKVLVLHQTLAYAASAPETELHGRMVGKKGERLAGWKVPKCDLSTADLLEVIKQVEEKI